MAEENYSRQSDAISNFIGWCVLVTTATYLPILFAGAKLTQIRPDMTTSLVWMGFPTIVLSLIGGLALVLHRQVGAYFIYLATILMSFGSMPITYVPLVKRLIEFGPYQGDVLMILNYLLVGVLAFDHWRS